MSRRIKCDECEGRSWTVTTQSTVRVEYDVNGEILDHYYDQEPTQELCAACHGEGEIVAITGRREAHATVRADERGDPVGGR